MTLAGVSGHYGAFTGVPTLERIRLVVEPEPAFLLLAPVTLEAVHLQHGFDILVVAYEARCDIRLSGERLKTTAQQRDQSGSCYRFQFHGVSSNGARKTLISFSQLISNRAERPAAGEGLRPGQELCHWIT